MVTPGCDCNAAQNSRNWRWVQIDIVATRVWLNRAAELLAVTIIPPDPYGAIGFEHQRMFGAARHYRAVKVVCKDRHRILATAQTNECCTKRKGRASGGPKPRHAAAWFKSYE